MQTVTSDDGTRIAFWRSGGGPALLLVGGDRPARELEHATGVAAALPEARVAVMPGQQHTAMYTAPELFVDAVVEFLGG